MDKKNHGDQLSIERFQPKGGEYFLELRIMAVQSYFASGQSGKNLQCDNGWTKQVIKGYASPQTLD